MFCRRAAILATALWIGGCGQLVGDPATDPSIGSADVNGNAAPVIEGAPNEEITVDTDFNFMPKSEDPDGDPLEFEIWNKPNWARFDTGNGELSGRPGMANIGDYRDIRIIASDAESSSHIEFDLSVVVGNSTAENSAPQISGLPPGSVRIGQDYSFIPKASDADGDALIFAVANLPEWADFDSATGEIGGQPVPGSAGVYRNIRITVSDQSSSAFIEFDVTVLEPEPATGNTAPTISGTPNKSATTNELYDFQPVGEDADGDTLSYSINNKPEWAVFDVATGRLRGTPQDGSEGLYSNIEIGVSDGIAQASLSFDLTVESADQRQNNVAPTISNTPDTTATVNQTYTFDAAATDPDGDALTYSITNKPRWASFDSVTGLLTGTPVAGDEGDYPNIRVVVSDDIATDQVQFDIRVEPETATGSNSAPTISGSPAATVEAGSNYAFTPTANDADEDELTFGIANMPAWMTFNSSTGRVAGTPAASDVGNYTGIVITVSDGQASANLSFDVEVMEPPTAPPPPPPPNNAPTISGSPATTVEAGSNYAFTPTASDADDDELTFSIGNQPAWMTFNSNTGRVAGTPAANDVGNYPGIVISVSDGQATSNLSFDVEVTEPPTAPPPPPPPNNAPTISGSPAATVEANSNYAFTPTASDADNDALSFAISNKPAWMTFNGNTGRVAGTPTAGDVGNYPGITITVSDGQASANLSFGVEVTEPPPPPPPANTAPTISGSPAATVEVDENYAFTPTASDADNDALSFSIANLPTWMSFNTSTGRIAGTPRESDVGNYTNIKITVSDGQANASMVFDVRVNEPEPAPNTAPTISGSPASSVAEGDPFQFTPAASDAENDTLTFSIANKPAWASFNTSTGRLAGTPGSADVGNYSNIRISVSDGQASAALSFDLEVVSVGNVSVTLSWTAPTENTDGSTLTDLAGYNIYYSTAPGGRTNKRTITNPSITTYVIENLTPALYYFKATALNQDGTESDLSNEVPYQVQ